MDDTAGIRARLGRIGALTEAGAGRLELLREVRGLLEEGERTVRREQPTADGRPAEVGGGARSGGGAQVEEPQAPRGGEATVS
jgi:hypothetical protein